MGIEEVRTQVHDVETKGIYWGSGNTRSQKQAGSGNRRSLTKVPKDTGKRGVSENMD